MKLLMFYAHEFWFKTAAKALDSAEEAVRDERVQEAVVIFVHAEAQDETHSNKVLTKLVKNVKWLAGKFSTKTVVLHSFSHLGTSKSTPEFAHQFLIAAKQRLENTDFAVTMTPFGYLHEFSIHVTGESLGRVFKEI